METLLTIGLITIILILILIWLVLKMLKQLSPNKPETVNPVQALPETATQQQDDTELIAVLTAAISMYLNTSDTNFNIKSYKRVNAQTPTWNTTGRNEILSSRL